MQFDPSIYERINERKQNAEQQNNQNLSDSISSIPKSLMAYVQQQNEQKQQGVTNRRNTLHDAIEVQNAGGDPSQVSAYESGIPMPEKNTGSTESPQSAQSPLQNMGGKPQNPMAGGNPMAQSPGPWSNPQPRGTPAATTGGAYSTPPAPMIAQQNGSQGAQALQGSSQVMQSGPQPMQGRGVLDHWDQQNPHLHSSQTLGQQPGQGQLTSAGISDSPQQPGSLSSIFPKQSQTDYGQVITKMANGDYSDFQKLPPKQQALLQADPRYKQMAKQSDNSETLTPVSAVAAIYKLDSDHTALLKKEFPNGMSDKQVGLVGNGVKLDATTGEKTQQFAQKEWDKIVKESDPLTATSRSGLGMASRADYNANRALTTLSKPMVTNQEAANVMADIAQIYQGGSATEYGMSHQGYTSLYGKIQNAIQMVTGKPQDAMPDAVKQRLIGVLNDMKTTNGAVIKQQLDHIEKSQPKVIGQFKDEWKGLRQNLEGGIAGGPQQQSSIQESHPQDSEAIQWAKQNPNDPRAQKIMRLNGGQ